nr:excinuclease ABC subunit UvrA [Streptoalloteichus tenebrarius]
MADRLVVRGAREHNLRGVDLELPRDSLIVFTGLSGSGKSSLAFDTIFAEGQRRYVESLSAYARQFLGQMDKPDVDFIEGLSPAVSIDQKSTSRNPRSTVGTITEVYDYLRLLYARAGKPHCPTCGEPISRQTPQQIVDQVLAMEEGTRFQVLAPVVRGRKGEYVDLFEQLQTQGFSRVRVDGEVHPLTEPPKLKKQEKHHIAVVVDRLTVKRNAKQRLTDSVETALRLADGLVVLEFVDLPEGDPQRERGFSERMACPNGHPLAIDELEPRSFSFNSPFGACPECTGIGVRKEVDPELVVPDDELSLAEGAIAPWAGGQSAEYFTRLLEALAETIGFRMDVPWRRLPAKVQKAVLHGVNEQVHVRYRNRYGRERAYYANFEGVIPFLERRLDQTESEYMREKYEGYMREVPCPACQGTRLKPEILAVTLEHAELGERSIAEVCAMSVRDCADFLSGLALGPRERMIAERVLKEVQARLGFLLDVGLDYLSLDRAAGTLSGGEAQRIRLATQIGSGLVGVLYVLDEPSIGLHQRDNHRLIETLTRLRDLGNTLIVVEHDEDTIRTSDWVVDIGPGAGEHGGQVVHSGPVEGLLSHASSLTGAYLSGRKRIAVPATRRPVDRKRQLTVVGAREHNLRSIEVSFPLGCLVAVTGVSGSGKSTLVNDILATVLANKLNGARQVPGRHTRVKGLEHVDKLVQVDQSPIGRTPRSNPATYTGVFDHIRKLFAATTEAKVRGYQPGPVLVQRQGRALRGVRRRRHHQDRDELPAGRLRPVRGVQGRPVQPGDPGGALQGQDDRRGPRHADRGGGGVLPADQRHPPAPADARRRGPGLRAAGPAGSDAVRRRGAAGEAGQRAPEALDRQDGLHPRRAHHGPALRGHPQAARRDQRPGGQGQHRDRHRAQPRRHQDGGLDHRHGAGGRLRRRHGGRRGHAGGRRGGRGQPHGPVPATRAGAAGARLGVRLIFTHQRHGARSLA